MKNDERAIAGRVVENLALEGWSLYQEVPVAALLDKQTTRGLTERHHVPWQTVCDIVAIKGSLAMAVEVKKSWSLALIDQAISWTAIFPLVAMAVPDVAGSSQHIRLKEHLREHFKIGLCAVSQNHLFWRYRPQLLRHNIQFAPSLKSILTESMQTVSQAGSVSTYRQTPYQKTMEIVRSLLAEKGPMKISDLMFYLDENALHHWSSKSSMKSGLLAAINDYEPDLVRNNDMISWHPQFCKKSVDYINHIIRRHPSGAGDQPMNTEIKIGHRTNTESPDQIEGRP